MLDEYNFSQARRNTMNNVLDNKVTTEESTAGTSTT